MKSKLRRTFVNHNKNYNKFKTHEVKASPSQWNKENKYTQRTLLVHQIKLQRVLVTKNQQKSYN